MVLTHNGFKRLGETTEDAEMSENVEGGLLMLQYLFLDQYDWVIGLCIWEAREAFILHSELSRLADGRIHRIGIPASDRDNDFWKQSIVGSKLCILQLAFGFFKEEMFPTKAGLR